MNKNGFKEYTKQLKARLQNKRQPQVQQTPVRPLRSSLTSIARSKLTPPRL